MNPDLEFDSYTEYIPHLYEICAELGLFEAEGRHINNEYDQKRFKRAVDLYCLEENIPFDDLLKKLVDEFREKRDARKKELGGMYTSKQWKNFFDYLERTLPASQPNHSKNDEYYDHLKDESGYDITAHPDDKEGTQYDDDRDGPKY